MSTWHKGRLLVATPALDDPNFDGTVLFMIEHSPEGALGVVLNRPLELPASEALPEWAAILSDPPVVFSGGPVSQGSALALAEATPDDAGEAFVPIAGGVGTLDLGQNVDDATAGVRHLRVFSGHASWGEQQLDAEIEAGAWYVVDARAQDVFEAEAEGLWRSVLRRQPGALGRVANHPPALWMN